MSFDEWGVIAHDSVQEDSTTFRPIQIAIATVCIQSTNCLNINVCIGGGIIYHTNLKNPIKRKLLVHLTFWLDFEALNILVPV